MLNAYVSLVIDSLSHVEVKICPLFSFPFCLFLLKLYLFWVYLSLFWFVTISSPTNKTNQQKTELTINQRLWLCTFTLSNFIDIGLCNLYRFFSWHQIYYSEKIKKKSVCKYFLRYLFNHKIKLNFILVQYYMISISSWSFTKGTIS